MTPPPPKTIPAHVWARRVHDHRQRLADLLGGYFAGRDANVLHPVLDFLFEYYPFRRAHLATWSAGHGILLEKGADQAPEGTFWHETADGYEVSDSGLTEKRRNALKRILALLQAIDARAPIFGCNGMHEWAMVYRSTEVRHAYLPLRLAPAQIDDFVETHPIRCSHFDAFRFFTDPAQPLNRLQPTRESQILLDQPGCLHVTLDLYKWAYKGYPWIGSELILDILELAVDVRTLDMQASPYDLGEYGYEAVPVETPAGRQEYLDRQKRLSERAAPLRSRLIRAYEALLTAND